MDDGSNHPIVKIGDSNHLYVFACLAALVAVSVALFLTEDRSEQPDDFVLVRFPHLRRGLAQVSAAGRLIILFFVCFSICHLSGSPMRIFSWLASKFRWMRHKASFPFGRTFSADVSAPCLSRGAFYILCWSFFYGEVVGKIWRAWAGRKRLCGDLRRFVEKLWRNGARSRMESRQEKIDFGRQGILMSHTGSISPNLTAL